jgi:hypothetical protein
VRFCPGEADGLYLEFEANLHVFAITKTWRATTIGLGGSRNEDDPSQLALDAPRWIGERITRRTSIFRNSEKVERDGKGSFFGCFAQHYRRRMLTAIPARRSASYSGFSFRSVESGGLSVKVKRFQTISLPERNGLWPNGFSNRGIRRRSFVRVT